MSGYQLGIWHYAHFVGNRIATALHCVLTTALFNNNHIMNNNTTAVGSV